ncbi:MAG TPA: SRPBCC domain-containing protein [Steroidobacteraceae bacterium]|nr:SRPBCC domain-containing protein [Steroidobacteraceae bacterium]
MNASVNTLPSAAVVVRRTIAASAEDLFDAFLDPQALAAWMRPGTIRSTVAHVEPRVGGRYEIIMQGESGPLPHTGVYRAIDRPKRLVFTWHSIGTEHKETLVTVDFLGAGASTEVVVTHEQLPESARPSHARGWTSGLEHLDEACRQGLV